MEAEIQRFQQDVWDYYARHARVMPWRRIQADNTIDPYYILVSELMLQQTQVQRVIPKFESFIATFPTVQSLAQAQLSDVLRQWQGLGYNRRAKFLWHAAQKIIDTYGGVIPATEKELETLPGVGKNTAAAIYCYVYNKPTNFIETNIRTVYIDRFFPDQDAVDDSAILELVEQSCDVHEPRQWYWALMDYGTHLKATKGNVSRQSKSYVKQSTFKGSRREIRGKILKVLTVRPQDYNELSIQIADDRLQSVLQDLEQEGFIAHEHSIYALV